MEASTRTVDEAFRAVRSGDEDAFAVWVGLVEPVLWKTLCGFAAAVDLEGIVQEALLRMWKLAPRLELSGADASLRFVRRLARNLAIDEARRGRRVHLVGPGELDGQAGDLPPDGPPDPELCAAVQDCCERLPPRPRAALEARLEDDGDLDDRGLAALLGMATNTFHKNLSRARQLMAACLRRGGWILEGLTA